MTGVQTCALPIYMWLNTESRRTETPPKVKRNQRGSPQLSSAQPPRGDKSVGTRKTAVLKLTFIIRIISQGLAKRNDVKKKEKQERRVNPGESHFSRLLRARIPVRKRLPPSYIVGYVSYEILASTPQQGTSCPVWNCVRLFSHILIVMHYIWSWEPFENFLL